MNENVNRRVHLRITGLVQGVSFRASACDAALELGVRGWVRNLPDGDVEAVAEGSAELVERFVSWAKRGPPSAEVQRVTVTEQPPEGASGGGFQVVR